MDNIFIFLKLFLSGSIQQRIQLLFWSLYCLKSCHTTLAWKWFGCDDKTQFAKTLGMATNSLPHQLPILEHLPTTNNFDNDCPAVRTPSLQANITWPDTPETSHHFIKAWKVKLKSAVFFQVL